MSKEKKIKTVKDILVTDLKKKILAIEKDKILFTLIKCGSAAALTAGTAPGSEP